MSRPFVLIHHPDPGVTDRLNKIALTLGARVRVVEDAGALPGELRKYGPDLAMLPPRMAGLPLTSFLRLLHEDTPLCRVVLLSDGSPEADGLASKVFAPVPVLPEVDAVTAAAVMRAVAEVRRSPGSVLVVEDQPVNLEMVADVLHAKGYRVMRAMTAEDSLEIAESGGPEMILMDIYLPGMNGIDAVRRLKHAPGTSVIPIVMLSANGTDSTVTEALESGAIDFIVKPFSPRRLVEKVAFVLEKREILAHA